MDLIRLSVLSVLIYTLLLASAVRLNAQNFNLSGGHQHSTMLCPNGNVVSWGDNEVGQLGTGTAGGNETTPVNTSDSLPAVTSLKAGSGAHTTALACDSIVWAWGLNTYGQLGRGNTAPGDTGDESHFSADPRPVDGGVTGDDTLRNVIYIAGGNNASYAVLENGRLVAWGINQKGELGNDGFCGCEYSDTPVYVRDSTGDPLENVVAIEAGDENGYALTEDGTVYSWGDGSDPSNTLGREDGDGNGPQTNHARPVRINDPNGPPLDNIELISGGDRHGLAIDSDGNVWSWGGDWGNGQIGQGLGYQNFEYAQQVVCGATCGHTPDPNNQDPLQNIQSLSAGQAHSAAITNDGYALSWGANGFFDANGNEIESGQQGENIWNPYQQTDQTVELDSGDNEDPAYMLKCNGDTMKNAREMSTGDAWTFIVDEDNHVWVAGYNANGQLGNGNTSNQNCLVDITDNLPCGFNEDCPVANIQPDTDTLEVCLPVNDELYAGNSADGGTYYNYQWYKNGDTLTGDTTAYYTAEDTGQYVVQVWDERPPSLQECEPCDTTYDTLNIAQIEAPFEKDSAYYCSDSTAYFSVTPDSNDYKWFNQLTGGDTLNPADSSHEISLHVDSTTSTANCDYGLFVEDISQFTDSAGEYSRPACGATTNQNYEFTRMQFTAHADLSYDSISFIKPANTGGGATQDYNVVIYRNDPEGYWNGSDDVDGPGVQIHTGPTVTLDNQASDRRVTIPVGNFEADQDSTYWVGLQGGDRLIYDCDANFSYWDNHDAIEYTQTFSQGGGPYDPDSDGNQEYGPFLTNFINVGTQYPCGRLLICADSSDCTLPVHFSEFQVYGVKNGAKLEWFTSVEENTSHFLIQKSTDGREFFTIEQVNAQGNMNSVQGYAFIDEEAGPDKVYYRVVSVDYNGNRRLTPVKSYYPGGKPLSVDVVPNPTDGNFEIRMSDANPQIAYKIRIVNGVGKVVDNRTLDSEGATQIQLNNQPPGVYTLRITGDNQTIVKKVIVR